MSMKGYLEAEHDNWRVMQALRNEAYLSLWYQFWMKATHEAFLDGRTYSVYPRQTGAKLQRERLQQTKVLVKQFSAKEIRIAFARRD